ncbi:MAG: retropepsin-like aspartic protease [Nitrospirales bacterium]
MKYLNKDVRAFTSYGAGFLHALVNEVHVSEAFDIKTQTDTPPQLVQFRALWDTGATNTCITNKIALQLGLKPSGKVIVAGVHGKKEVLTYLVNVFLPNGVAFPGVRATEAEINGADVLIGMDIIRTGDFAVSNFNGRTIFSFRFPSVEEIDFQREIGEAARPFTLKAAHQPKSKQERNRLKQQRRKNRGK